MPLSAIFQLYHGDQFEWWKKPERTTKPLTNEQYFMARTCYISMRSDDDVRFILDFVHASLVGFFYSASSLKQQFVCRHVVPLRHIILIPSQPVFVFAPQCCVLSEYLTNTNFIVWLKGSKELKKIGNSVM